MICQCNGQIANTGLPTGLAEFGVIYGLYMVPLIANDGTRNGLDISTPTTLGTQLLAMVNNVDPSKRAYPLMGLNEVNPETATPEYQTFSNGTRKKLRDGIAKLSYQIVDVNEVYFGKIKDNCTEFGLYLVDTCGNVKGEVEGTKFYPRPVNAGSYSAMFMPRKDANVAYVQVEFDYDIISGDENQTLITYDEFGANVPSKLKGLIDVNFDVTVTDDTNLVVKAYSDFGTATQKLPVRGLLMANFTVRNTTGNTNVTLTSVTESTTTPGTYAVVLASAQTTADDGTIDIFKASTGILMNGLEGRAKEFVFA